MKSDSDDRLNGIPTPETIVRRARFQQRCQTEFIRGPIPLWWLAMAATLGKQAISAGILLWFRAGCTGTKTALPVSQNQFKRFGLSSDTYNRGLSKLEAAGLVEIDR